MHEILPGILEQDWSAIEKKLEIIKPFAQSVHVDIIYGKFAPNTTFLDPSPYARYTKDMLFELHMMVEEPESYLEAWAKAGFRRFIGHIEKMSDQTSFIAKAEELGEAGLAVDGKTSLEQIKVSYQDIDTMLIMTINAGFSGQSFMPEYLDKVKTLSDLELFPIEIDGGVNSQTIKQGLAAGARRFVSTSYLFSSPAPEKAYHGLLSSAASVSA